MLQIGSLKLGSNVLLAPMAGISDSSFRMLCRKFGASFTFVEMINARAISHKSKKTKLMLSTAPSDKPIGVQLLGAEIPYLLRALEVISGYPFDLLDFNAACPVRKVCRRGEGAALAKDPEKLKKILEALVRRSSMPVTIKIRRGWDPAARNAELISRIAEDAGVKAVFIHGRDREQFYKGTVDYGIIAAVKKSVRIPVIASGDVFSGPLARKMFDETGCDGILVARGALGNPWIFREINSCLSGEAMPPPPTTKEIVAVIIDHLQMVIAEHGEKKAIPIMRKFIGWYLKGKPFIRSVRQKISTIKTKNDFLATVKSVC